MQFTNSKLKYPVYVLLSVIYLYYIWPFINNVVFDSVIHFSFAERFSQGLPFHYNLHEQNVIASTSPFWTIILILAYAISGYKFIIYLKIFILIIWAGTTYIIYLISRDIWKFSKIQSFALLVFWMINVSALKNSFGGMENILSAFQLALLFLLLFRFRNHLNTTRTIILGVLSGWTILTRPEIGVLSLIIILLFCFFNLKNKNITHIQFWKYIFVLFLFAVIVLLPWYIYQYNITGKIISDSSFSRIYSGRWNSVVLINNILYFHPFLFRALLTAFLPFTVGIIALLTKIKIFKNNFKKSGFSYIYEKFFVISTGLILLFGIICYSFIVGGNQIGRYFLTFYPFLFIAGISGLNIIYSKLSSKNIFPGRVFILIICIFLLSTNLYDFYERIIMQKEMESNITEILDAPRNRKELTTEYLKDFKFNITDTINLAITEVQFRYFADDRINILSLDGRSSALIFRYMNESKVPDFEAFINKEHPDIIEVGGWSDLVNHSSFFNIFRFGMSENILSRWDEKTSGMKVGESFLWNSHIITYVKEKNIKINWNK